MVAAFDTLSVAKALQAAGFAQEQAEAVAEAIRSGQGELATRQDTAVLRGELAGLRSGLDAQQVELAGLRSGLDAQQVELAGLRSGLDAQQGELAGLRSGLDAQQAELGGLRADYAGLRAEVGAVKWVLGLVAALNIAILVRLLLA